VKPTTIVRKILPFAHTFDLRSKEKEHDSEPTFVRKILLSLKENAVYDIGAINRVKPMLEVKSILQRVGLTNPRSVVANRHLTLGQTTDTLVLPMSIPMRDLSPNAVVSIGGAVSPIHIARQLASAAKRDPDCFENITDQHPVKEVSALHNDPRRGGVLSPDEQRGAAWRACRKAVKRGRHRELRLANLLFESQVPIEKDIRRLETELATSQWLIRLKMLDITETEWTSVRNHLSSTGPEFFRRVKKGDAVVRCNSLRYTAQSFQPAAPAFLRNGMPEQRLIDTVHMIRAADQMRVSEGITARDGALVQSASSVNNAGDVGHAPRAGGRRSNRPGNHKERRFRRNKRLKAQAQANAKRRQWQPGWQFRACIPDDRPQHGAHPPNIDNVHPAHPTGKFPRLQKVWPREQRSTPFTNRIDFYR